MSYLDEISGGGYYLNAFNNLLKRRQMENAAQNQMVSSGGQMPQMMGGGGDGRSSNSGWDALSNAEKAAYYSDNPTMAAVTQFGQKAIGYAPFGVGLAMKAQELMFPQFVAEQASIARGIDPATGLQVGGYGSQPGPSGITPTGLYGDEFAGMPAPAKPDNFFASLLSGILPSSNVTLDPAPVETREATPVGFSSPTSNFGKESNIPTEGIVSPGMDSSVSSGNDFGSFSGSFDSGGYEGGGYYNQGGIVDAENLMGEAPAPDDGYGALQGGEYVITKAAVERYGKAMMDAINNGTFR